MNIQNDPNFALPIEFIENAKGKGHVIKLKGINKDIHLVGKTKTVSQQLMNQTNVLESSFVERHIRSRNWVVVKVQTEEGKVGYLRLDKEDIKEIFQANVIKGQRIDIDKELKKANYDATSLLKKLTQFDDKEIGDLYAARSGTQDTPADAKTAQAQAIQYYHQAGEKGDYHAFLKAGLMHLENMNYSEAIEEFSKAARKGNQEALKQLLAMAPLDDIKKLLKRNKKGNLEIRTQIEDIVKSKTPSVIPIPQAQQALAMYAIGRIYEDFHLDIPKLFGLNVTDIRNKENFSEELYARLKNEIAGPQSRLVDNNNTFKPSRSEFYKKNFGSNDIPLSEIDAPLKKYLQNQKEKQAFEWYKMAADRGYPTAQYQCALMLENGKGVEKSNKEAMAYYQKAAHAEHPEAQNRVGEYYLFLLERIQFAINQGDQNEKWEAKKNDFIHEMFVNFALAADQGNKNALEHLEKLKINPALNAENQIKILNKLAFLYQQNNEIEKAADCHFEAIVNRGNFLQKAAQIRDEINNPELLKILGDKFAIADKQVEQVEADLFYEKAIDLGSIEAIYIMGQRCLANVEKRYAAMDYFRRAADLGHAGAQLEAGKIAYSFFKRLQPATKILADYVKAKGIKEQQAELKSEVFQAIRNKSDAIKYLVGAAEKGNAEAFLYLGRLSSIEERLNALNEVKVELPLELAKSLFANEPEMNRAIAQAEKKKQALVAIDSKFASQFFIEAAEKGNKTAIRELETLGQAGDFNAMRFLSIYHRDIEKKPKEEKEWLEKIAAFDRSQIPDHHLKEWIGSIQSLQNIYLNDAVVLVKNDKVKGLNQNNREAKRILEKAINLANKEGTVKKGAPDEIALEKYERFKAIGEKLKDPAFNQLEKFQLKDLQYNVNKHMAEEAFKIGKHKAQGDVMDSSGWEYLKTSALLGNDDALQELVRIAERKSNIWQAQKILSEVYFEKYKNAEPGFKDEFADNALKMGEKASKSKFSEAILDFEKMALEIGNDYFDKGEFSKAFDLYAKAAEPKNIMHQKKPHTSKEAIVKLEEMYLKHHAHLDDPLKVKFTRFFEKIAKEMNSGAAYLALGKIYERETDPLKRKKGMESYLAVAKKDQYKIFREITKPFDPNRLEDHPTTKKNLEDYQEIGQACLGIAGMYSKKPHEIREFDPKGKSVDLLISKYVLRMGKGQQSISNGPIGLAIINKSNELKNAKSRDDKEKYYKVLMELTAIGYLREAALMKGPALEEIRKEAREKLIEMIGRKGKLDKDARDLLMSVIQEINPPELSF